MHLLSWALLGAVLGGCQGAEEGGVSGPTWVGLGEQDEQGQWRALTDGQPLRIHAGLQGGYHVELVARWRGLRAQGLTVTYAVREEGKKPTINWPARFILSDEGVSCDPQGMCGRGVDIVQLDGWQPEVFDGMRVEVTLTVERSLTERYVITQQATLVY
jgi:hypothetical protein